MAQLPSSFNPSAPEQKGTGDFSPAPPGTYTAQVTETEVKRNGKDTGSYVAIVWTILAPEEFAGKRVFSNLNVDNPSQQAVEIANKHMKSMADAMGITGVIENSDVFLMKPVALTIKIKKGDAQYPDKNECVSYEAIGGVSPGAAAAVAGAVPNVTPGVAAVDVPSSEPVPAEGNQEAPKVPWA